MYFKMYEIALNSLCDRFFDKRHKLANKTVHGAILYQNLIADKLDQEKLKYHKNEFHFKISYLENAILIILKSEIG